MQTANIKQYEVEDGESVPSDWMRREYQTYDPIHPQRAYTIEEVRHILRHPNGKPVSTFAIYDWVKNYGLIGKPMSGKERGHRMFMGQDLINFIRGRSS